MDPPAVCSTTGGQTGRPSVADTIPGPAALDWEEGGAREGGTREGGAKEGGVREGGAREGGEREGGARRVG